MVKLLKDTTYKGGSKNWSKDKYINSIIAKKLRSVSGGYGNDTYHRKQIRVADDIENCCQWLKFKKKPNGNLKLHDTRFCKNRLCQICEKVRYNRESGRLFACVNQMQDYKFLVGTFTFKNVDCNKTNGAISDINYAWSKMKKYKDIHPYLKGAVKKVECKLSKDGKSNVHIHVLMAVSSSFYYGKNSLNHAQWSKLWTRAMKTDYSAEVYVQRKTSLKSLKKACNYLCKSYVVGDDNNNWSIKDIDKIIDITDGQYRKQLIVYSGVFRDVDRLVNAKYKNKKSTNTGKHRQYIHDNQDTVQAKNGTVEIADNNQTIETYTCRYQNGKFEYILKT
jgi:plasmid rolling circle replication initiator protein Rep